VSDPEQIFRTTIDAILAEDFETASGYLDADVVFDWSRSRGPLQGVYRGTEGAQSVWVNMQEAWEPLEWELEVIGRPDAERIVVDSKPRTRGRVSGIEMQGHGGLIVRVRDGKIVKVTLFQSPEEALAAAEDGD
jgi:ketosteroid isomerase-like protein